MNMTQMFSDLRERKAEGKHWGLMQLLPTESLTYNGAVLQVVRRRLVRPHHCVISDGGPSG